MNMDSAYELHDRELHDYDTGDFIRAATRRECLASIEASETDGGAGVILVADQGERRCSVRCATHYEITMTTPSATTVLGYTSCHTRSALVNVMRANRDALLAAFDGNDFVWVVVVLMGVKTFGFYNAQGFGVGFSGYTERQAADQVKDNEHAWTD